MQEKLADLYLKDLVIAYDTQQLLSVLSKMGAHKQSIWLSTVGYPECVRAVRIAGLASLLLELGVITSLHPLVF